MKIKGYLIDVNNPDNSGVKEIEKNLEGYYKLLECDMIDITSRRIGGEWYEIVCDDEALLKNNPVVSAIDSEYNLVLCGNLFIAKYDGDGDLMSLENEDIVNIEQNLVTFLPDFRQLIRLEY